MHKNSKLSFSDWIVISCVIILITVSNFVLRSINPSIFPDYYLYLFAALIIFYLLLKIDFEIFLTFSGHLYVMSVFFLVVTLILGQVTRGSIRWIPLGPITLQPSEVFRAFVLLFLAKYATEKEIDISRFIKLSVYFLIPFVLILIQPSLGVAVITGVGFLGIIFASSINKRILFSGFLILFLIMPLTWFLLAPYQKERVTTFLNPYSDPLGSGYNSIQSTISVGSGRLSGRGLGQGVQTQLAYLPEKHTDFIFAATSEELGFLGASLILTSFAVLFYFLIKILENPVNPAARVFVSAIFFIFLSQTFIHVGMNMGIVPITGLPLPFVSAGGSALLGGFISLAIAMKAKDK
jgi:rod shape determining protein RodA